MSENKHIRFINSDYKTLFYLPDGGRIRITHSDGEQVDRVCRFIDEYHTAVGNNIYHICEFAERMEQIGARYAQLDYIREPEFYTQHFFTSGKEDIGPAYYIIDETKTHGFAFAPKGAEKGKKYCVFEIVQYGEFTIPGEAVLWSGNLRDIRPQDWGFDLAKIKGITQNPKKTSQHKRRTGPRR